MKKSEKLKYFNISTKTFIIVSVFMLLFIFVLIYNLVMIRTFRSEYIEQTLDAARSAGYQISDEIIRSEMSFEDGTTEYDVTQTANVLNGRIMVVNTSYEIVSDTYMYKKGAYLISSDAISIMTGAEEEISNVYDDYMEIILPIKDVDEIKGVIVITLSLGNENEVSDSVVSRVSFLVVIILIIFAAGAFVIAKYSVKGMNRISAQISMLSGGNLDEELPVRGFKETRIMAEKYNEVINKLNSIDSSRQEFVSNVSHELKTPITSMKVLADSLLQNENVTEEMYKEFMNDIVDELDRETKIINDLLVMVKTEKQAASLNITEEDINALIEVILKRVTPMAQTRNIEIIYESYREVNAEVDEVKLSLAISNLIENAIKYNVDNGWVKVSLNADHKYFYIKVADSGVGIPDDCKEQVFERFYRVDKARSRDTGGTGLGLSIARNSILMHGGTIKLYSESGKGTTFTVKLPIKHVETKNEKGKKRI